MHANFKINIEKELIGTNFKSVFNIYDDMLKF